VWPSGSIALHESTTALSTIVSIDESPLLEGLIYVGTDDGLLQVTEDGGKSWRKVEDFPGVPKWTYVSDVFASPRDSNLVFVALNNWQTGDYKPYLLKSTDRGRTFTSIAGNLPALHDVWAIAQDHVNGDLLFAGTEFGLFFTVDGGRQWTQLRGNMPPAQVRDLQLQKRESDVVMATFGRGFWILDDYSALREVNATSLDAEAYLFPLRSPYQFTPWGLAQDGSAGLGTLGGNQVTPNPPSGAVFTYNVRETLPENTRLVLNITDSQGRQVRRLDLDKTTGFRRLTWNLRGDQPAANAGDVDPWPTTEDRDELEQQQQAEPPPQQQPQAGQPAGGRGAGGRQGGAAGGRQGGAAGGAQGGGGFGGRGQQMAFVPLGLYRAQLAKVTGETVTPVGPVQTFQVKPLLSQNYQLYR